MSPIIIGTIILFIGYAFSRSIMTKALRDLDDNTQLKVYEVLSKTNNYRTFLVIGLAIVFFGALQFYPQFGFSLSIIYLTLFAFYLIGKFASKYRKLKEIEVPSFYMQSFITGCAAFMLGFTAFAGCFLWEWF